MQFGQYTLVSLRAQVVQVIRELGGLGTLENFDAQILGTFYLKKQIVMYFGSVNNDTSPNIQN